MLSIKEARYIKDYELELTFSDGRVGRADLSDLVHEDARSVFDPLKDKEVFKNFTVDYTIHWGADIDLAPEYLYFKSFEKDEGLQGQFKEWGYVA